MYYLIYGLLYLISLLPFRVLYGLSDLIAFILYKWVRYRRDVVQSNLEIAFPEKTEEERDQICRAFYYRFSDNFIELLKLISLPPQSVQKRFKCDIAFMQQLHKEGLSVDFVLGHYFNWEWSNLAYAQINPLKQLVVYAHVSSPIAERLMHTIRSRFGTILIDSQKFKEQYKPYALEQKSFVLVADQNPRFIKGAVWLKFFGRRTAFTRGPDTNARMANNAVVLCQIKRIKRGYYTTHLELLTRAARELPRGEITRKSVAFFEKVIREDPPNYLWSHRRWKHSFQPERDSKNLLDEQGD